jgi:hypothetical protein
MAGSSFILENPSLTLATESVMFVFSVLGFFFNGLAVYITFFRLKIRSASIGLMAIIAILDVFTASAVLSTGIIKFATAHQILNNNYFCQYTGAIFMTFPMSSVDGVGLLSVLRLLSITREIEIEPIYWYIAMGLMFAFNVIINVIGIIDNINQVMPSQSYCHARLKPGAFSEVFSILVLSKFLLMFTILMVSYTWITYRVCKSFSNVNSRKNGSSNHFIAEVSYTGFQKKIVLKLLVLILLYMISFAPELITVFYTAITKKSITPVADSISGVTLSFSILVNSVFVLIYQIESREILLSMLPRWIHNSKYKSKPIELSDFQI